VPAENTSHSFHHPRVRALLQPKNKPGFCTVAEIYGVFTNVFKNYKKKNLPGYAYIIRPKFHFLLKTKNIIALKR
jgi:hypothetical protein